MKAARSTSALITASIDAVSKGSQIAGATAEETSALCASINGQSSQLHEQVAAFELRD